LSRISIKKTAVFTSYENVDPHKDIQKSQPFFFYVRYINKLILTLLFGFQLLRALDREKYIYEAFSKVSQNETTVSTFLKLHRNEYNS